MGSTWLKVEEALRRFAAVAGVGLDGACTEAAGERLPADEGRPHGAADAAGAGLDGGGRRGSGPRPTPGVGRLRRADAGAGGEPGRASNDVHGAAVHPRQKAYAVSGGF